MALRSVRQPVGAFQLRGSGDGDESSSPESGPQLYQSLDADSGHSTTNSPDGPASLPGTVTRRPTSSTGLCCNCGVTSVDDIGAGGASYHDLSRLVATHRGLHKFVPRHRDEIEVEIGDPVYVQRECDDLWCEGVNMRTGRQGAFPSAYAVDLEYREFDPEAASGDVAVETGGRRDRFLLDYLGSVESLHYKGNAVLCQAVRRISVRPPPARQVILEVSDMGIRMLGRDRHHEAKTPVEAGDDKNLDYFYSLKNVSFCGFHPRDQRFLGFITKHPQRQRFACHTRI
ncbi:hypothetical protein B566_EDAN015277 [Ephemera danica]|nr:hypothetical protein B566_EDAN015277 [Ephemera danica]